MKSKDNIIDFENSIAPWLGRTVKVIDCYLQETFKAQNIDLSREQMIILKTLYNNNGIQQNELACLTYRDKSSMARLLDTMATKHYIIRKHSKNDKRINKVYLTEKGEEIFYKTMPILRSTIETMECGIKKNEIKNIIVILEKIQMNLKTDIKSF